MKEEKVMKIKKILAFTLALIMTVGIFAGCGAQTETAAPADFAIRLEVWIDGSQRNILDTYEGYIQKDLVADGVSRQDYTPGYAEKCQLYYAVWALVENIDLDFSRPVTYDNYSIYNNSIMMSPLTCISA